VNLTGEHETVKGFIKMFISIKEAAKLLDIKESTLYVWAERGEIPSYKFGRLVRLKKDDIEAWAESRKVIASSVIHLHYSQTGNIKKLVENVKRAVLTSREGKARHASGKGG
jgi:excisionase family DNA binding protein